MSRIISEWQQFEAAHKPVPVALAPALAEISRQRVMQLLRAGTYRRLDFSGRKFVALADIIRRRPRGRKFGYRKPKRAARLPNAEVSDDGSR